MCVKGVFEYIATCLCISVCVLCEHFCVFWMLCMYLCVVICYTYILFVSRVEILVYDKYIRTYIFSVDNSSVLLMLLDWLFYESVLILDLQALGLCLQYSSYVF